MILIKLKIWVIIISFYYIQLALDDIRTTVLLHHNRTFYGPVYITYILIVLHGESFDWGHLVRERCSCKIKELYTSTHLSQNCAMVSTAQRIFSAYKKLSSVRNLFILEA